MTNLSDDAIRAFRKTCHAFISESRLALGEVTSSHDAARAAERAEEARARCAEIFKGTALETVATAAIRVGPVVYIVPRPGRHHDVLRAMPEDVAVNSHIDDQGFVTSAGRFVDRKEAAAIARAANQLIREPTPRDMLTSEDVW